MAQKAILLANLGSPDSPDVKDVRRYLNEFLMDERVIDVPYFFRMLLVKGMIVPFRAPKSAAKYAGIWTDNGSPLIHITRQLTELVQKKSNVPAYMCMRYANPAPAGVLRNIAYENPDLEELIFVPLYPHYAMSSYESAVEHVQSAYRSGNYPFQIRVVPPFYNDRDYINALAESIQPYIQQEYDHILFSYHGVPERHIRKSDPTKSHCLLHEDCCNTASEAHKTCYRKQVIATTTLVAGALNIPQHKFSYSFQSRLGQDKWLKPFTVEELRKMPSRGIRTLVVVCPAFVSDCLETLEEIRVEGKEEFENAGGTSFTVVPCLNTNDSWVDTIHSLVSTSLT